MTVRRWQVALLAAVAGLCADARSENFALLSVISSQVTLVKYEGETGTRRGGVAELTFDLADPALDLSTVAAVEEVVRRRDPGAGVARLSVGDGTWIAAVRKASIDEGADLGRLLDPVVTAAANAGASRLVLIVPARGNIRIRVQEGYIGRGRAAGLGLYVDRGLRVRRAETMASGGLLGMFANFRIVVLDVATKRPLAESMVVAGHGYSGATSADLDPLNALTAEQKIAAWRRLLSESLEAELPPLLERASR